jgi:hypothetical protein
MSQAVPALYSLWEAGDGRIVRVVGDMLRRHPLGLAVPGLWRPS